MLLRFFCSVAFIFPRTFLSPRGNSSSAPPHNLFPIVPLCHLGYCTLLYCPSNLYRFYLKTHAFHSHCVNLYRFYLQIHAFHSHYVKFILFLFTNTCFSFSLCKFISVLFTNTRLSISLRKIYVVFIYTNILFVVIWTSKSFLGV